jgi:ribonuclease III
MPLSPLESRLRYEFRNAELLRQALTHRSHSASHNERLEFLGDSVLNCAVAALLFQRFGKLDEGDLSRVRANLVKQQSLYEIAQALNISEGLRLGEGELRSGGFRRPSILADAFEAILGAVFLDGGFEAAQTVIKRLYVPILDHIDPRTLGKDSKTLLQEYLQGHKIALPTYTVVATHGAAHNQQFEVECTVPKLDIKVSGSGASRRAAEQAAAKKALEEVMALTPAMEVKAKRSRGARAAKQHEPEIVPGVKGVQAALDLRTPERSSKSDKERAVRAEAEKVARGEAKAPSQSEAAERMAPAPALAPAMMRAAHVEHKPATRPPDAAAKSDAAVKGEAVAKNEGAEKTEAPPSQKTEGAVKAELVVKTEGESKAEALPSQKVEGSARSAPAGRADGQSKTEALPSQKAEDAARAEPVGRADGESKTEALPSQKAEDAARAEPAGRADGESKTEALPSQKAEDAARAEPAGRADGQSNTEALLSQKAEDAARAEPAGRADGQSNTEAPPSPKAEGAARAEPVAPTEGQSKADAPPPQKAAASGKGEPAKTDSQTKHETSIAPATPALGTPGTAGGEAELVSDVADAARPHATDPDHP